MTDENTSINTELEELKLTDLYEMESDEIVGIVKQSMGELQNYSYDSEDNKLKIPGLLYSLELLLDFAQCRQLEKDRRHLVASKKGDHLYIMRSVILLALFTWYMEKVYNYTAFSNDNNV